MKRIGLDWSGDPGDTRKRGSSPRLVIVAASIGESDIGRAHEALRSVKAEHRLPEQYVFKHSHTLAEIRISFFKAVADCDVCIYANSISKQEWPANYVQRTNGGDRIVDGIATLVLSMPDESINQGTLIIDLDKRENAFVLSIRKRLRDDLCRSGRPGFRRIKAVPDHRPEAALVQVADMLAGALCSETWIAEKCPERLGRNIKLV